MNGEVHRELCYWRNGERLEQVAERAGEDFQECLKGENRELLEH